MRNDPDYEKTLRQLPEIERRAYLEGDHTAFEGQFFKVSGLSKEAPFMLQESDCYENLYGALDHGIVHNTSFSLNYIDKNNRIHRLFTYLNNGGSAESHAREIRNRIESFTWTHGHLPQYIWYDPSMDTKRRLSQHTIRSDIDEYKDIFRGTRVIFHTANNDKQNGCHVMRMLFDASDGLPKWFYWDGFNNGLTLGLQGMIGDKNHPEIYQKVDGDDIVDECRYGMVGMYNVVANRKNNIYNENKMKAYNRKREKVDWFIGV
jgi:hypothetical protein